MIWLAAIALALSGIAFLGAQKAEAGTGTANAASALGAGAALLRVVEFILALTAAVLLLQAM